MPIFEYACRGCGEEFELLVQGMAQASCPSCESLELEKKLSTFAVAGHAAAFSSREPIGPCGTCGDPRGAGSCALD